MDTAALDESPRAHVPAESPLSSVWRTMPLSPRGTVDAWFHPIIPGAAYANVDDLTIRGERVPHGSVFVVDDAEVARREVEDRPDRWPHAIYDDIVKFERAEQHTLAYVNTQLPKLNATRLMLLTHLMEVGRLRKGSPAVEEFKRGVTELGAGQPLFTSNAKVAEAFRRLRMAAKLENADGSWNAGQSLPRLWSADWLVVERMSDLEVIMNTVTTRAMAAANIVDNIMDGLRKTFADLTQMVSAKNEGWSTPERRERLDELIFRIRSLGIVRPYTHIGDRMVGENLGRAAHGKGDLLVARDSLGDGDVLGAKRFLRRAARSILPMECHYNLVELLGYASVNLRLGVVPTDAEWDDLGERLESLLRAFTSLGDTSEFEFENDPVPDAKLYVSVARAACRRGKLEDVKSALTAAAAPF